MELDLKRLPRHVAIIMDGNGRWARQRIKNRVFGHRKGAENVRGILTCCNDLGIRYLTLYTFSAENWNRPGREVRALWGLLERFLNSELPELVQNRVRIRHIGEDADIPASNLRQLMAAEAQTAHFDGLTLTLALNYGGRQEILRAAERFACDVKEGLHAPGQLSSELFSRYLYDPQLPDPDLVIRTGAEIRVSNFLLWQIAYAELYFTETLWPDFSKDDFTLALAEFQRRERRFGRTGEQVKTGSSSSQRRASPPDVPLSGSGTR